MKICVEWDVRGHESSPVRAGNALRRQEVSAAVVGLGHQSAVLGLTWFYVRVDEGR